MSLDLWADNKSCSTNGADVLEEGFVKYYFKKKFEKEIRNKVSGDLHDTITLSMGQLVL